jgi:hypothetical protein
VVAGTWEHNCPWTDEWIDKMWYIHTMDYYSAIKSSEILMHAATQMKTLC